MPAKSAKQERFMRAVAHDPAFASKVGVAPAVGAEFTALPISSVGGVVKSGSYLPAKPRKVR